LKGGGERFKTIVGDGTHAAEVPIELPVSKLTFSDVAATEVAPKSSSLSEGDSVANTSAQPSKSSEPDVRLRERKPPKDAVAVVSLVPVLAAVIAVWVMSMTLSEASLHEDGNGTRGLDELFPEGAPMVVCFFVGTIHKEPFQLTERCDLAHANKRWCGSTRQRACMCDICRISLRSSHLRRWGRCT
jgi:hypothetical protein